MIHAILRLLGPPHFAFNLLGDNKNLFRRIITLAHSHHIRKLILRHKPLWSTPIDGRTCQALPHSLVQHFDGSAQILLAIPQISSYAEIYNHHLIMALPQTRIQSSHPCSPTCSTALCLHLSSSPR